MKHAFRSLAKSPGFAAVAIATLALGIGACTAMFSIVHTVLLKPLPFREPSRLVWIENDGTGGLSARTSRTDVFTAWREQNRSFEALAAYFAFFDYGRLTLSGSGEPERLRGVGVSDNFIDVLGIPLAHGRNFIAEECVSLGSPAAVILSHHYWKTRFAADPSVVGRTIILNDRPTTIVGVIAAGFDFDAVFSPGSDVEVITPFPLNDETARWGNTIFGLGRLRSGVTIEQARAEFETLTPAIIEKLNFGYGAGVRMTPLDEALRAPFRTAFYVLTGAVACVLAIACVNLSNLLLARINARRQEFVVRIALGARRRHLVQQALTESLLLAVAGSTVGIPLAMWATEGLAQLQTFGVPLLQNAEVSPIALFVTIGLTLLAGVICGVLPALHLTRLRSATSLASATHQRTAGRPAVAARNALVVAEVAIACVLLVGAGLLIRSFGALLEVNLGFQPQHAMAWRVDVGRNFDRLADVNRYYDALRDRIASLPGVESVGLTDCLPLGRNRTWGAGARGVEYPPGEYPIAFPRIVDEGYLPTMQIPLRAGRQFDERDHADAPKAVIINETFARRLWPDRDPIGQVLEVNGGSVVIGVVGDVRHSSLEAAGGNEIYLSYRQMFDISSVELVVRSTRPPAALVPEVRATLAAFDPSLPSGEFRTLDTLIDDAVAPRRLIMQLLGCFSTLALALAALGLYGVIAYSITQRTQEIGVRMAIGAQCSDVIGLVMRGGLKLVALGVILGVAGSLVLTRLLETLLYGVSAHDPFVFAANSALLFMIAAIACLLPALRATRVDPIVALRAD